ncbi:hypothetical protein KJ633_00205 [bacterium]|nr:hypothetical protein [bacterium]MBU4133987.1 hypothetical protein [bacterium]
MKKNAVILRIVLIVLFAVFVSEGVRKSRPGATGGIASSICLACMGF